MNWTWSVLYSTPAALKTDIWIESPHCINHFFQKQIKFSHLKSCEYMCDELFFLVWSFFSFSFRFGFPGVCPFCLSPVVKWWKTQQNSVSSKWSTERSKSDGWEILQIEIFVWQHFLKKWKTKTSTFHSNVFKMTHWVF